MTIQKLYRLYMDHAILKPWALEYQEIMDQLQVRINASAGKHSPQDAHSAAIAVDEDDDDIRENSVESFLRDEHWLDGLDAATSNVVPNGFQNQMTLTHNRPSLRLVLFQKPLQSNKSMGGITSKDRFLTMDANFLYVWLGSKRSKKLRLPTAGEDVAVNLNPSATSTASNKSGFRTNIDLSVATSMNGVMRWCWIDKYRAVAIATSNLHLRLLDGKDYRETSEVHCVKPVLSMLFVDDLDYLVAGGVGNIRVWSVRKSAEPLARGQVLTFESEPRYVMEDMHPDQWVRSMCYDATKQRLYTARDRDISIHSLKDGQKIGGLRNAHILSINCIAIHERTQHLVTGGKDNLIKVWNAQCQHVATYRDHNGPITGLLFMEPSGVHFPEHSTQQNKTPSLDGMNADNTDSQSHTDNGRPFQLRHHRAMLPYLLSSSEDGTVRTWLFGSERWVYKMEAPKAVLGMEWMRSDTLYYYTNENVYTATMHRSHQEFTILHSRPTKVTRIGLGLEPNGLQVDRLLVTAEDGSARIISPVTASTLTIAFPFFRDVPVRDVIYDPGSERLYSWLEDGDIIVYDSAVNPCKVVDHWTELNVSKNRMQMGDKRALNCLASMVILDRGQRTFWLIGGIASGELVVLNTEMSGHMEVICQGHNSPISTLGFCDKQQMLFSVSDGLIKAWKVTVISSQTDLSMSRQFKSIRNQNRGLRDLQLTLQFTIPYSTASFIDPRELTCHPEQSSISLTFRLMTGQSSNEDNAIGSLGALGDQLTIFHIPTASCVLQSTGAGDYHINTITQKSSLVSLGLHLSVSLDGCAKIWDGETNVLIREMNFAEPLYAGSFINDRGDFVIGMRDGLFTIKGRDYLPLGRLARLCKGTMLAEQAVEDGILFDPFLSMWSMFRRYSEELKTQEQPKVPVMDRDILHILSDTELEKRMMAFFHDRLLHENLRQERKAFDMARYFEPIMRFTHLSNSGVQWKHFVENFVHYRPDLAPKMDGLDPETLRRFQAIVFNGSPRLESAVDLLGTLNEGAFQEPPRGLLGFNDTEEFDETGEEIALILGEIDKLASPTLNEVFRT